MTDLAVLGAGAFGTALAIALARDGRAVTLWARDPGQAAALRTGRENARRLAGHALPDGVAVTGDLAEAAACKVLLLAVPMQELRPFLAENAALMRGRTLVSCCKGIDLVTGEGPDEVMATALPDAPVALLSGPGFASDIAAGLPTALTLAAAGAETAKSLQRLLSTATLRLYRSQDMAGVAMGGAIKNVIAIACGVTMGAGLGESARAAIMTRGYAEMRRHALNHGAREETLSGLSGLGDLALTCTSEKSRNYRFGLGLGREGRISSAETTEGIATARALAARVPGEMPVTRMVAALVDGHITVAEATGQLLSRPLREE